MNLPPLPGTIYLLTNPGAFHEQEYTLTESAYTEEQMMDFYQKGRAAALDEAARICHGIATGPSNVVLGVAMECYEKIRSMK